MPSALFQNEQNGTFTDISAGSGFTDEAWTRAGTYGDYEPALKFGYGSSRLTDR